MSEKFLLEMNAPGFEGLVGDNLLGFNYVESMGGCARWAVSFDTQDNKLYDAFLKQDEVEFTLRFGTGMNTDGPQHSKKKLVRILKPKKRMAGNARITFNVKGTCAGIRLQRHRSKDKHWRERRISEIVDELVSEVGLEAEVEETEGKFNLMGCNLPTGKFIKRDLLPLAHSRSGNDWRLWVEDGRRVHFSPADPKGKVLRFTNLYRNGWLKLKSPELIKDRRFDAEDRTGKIEVVMYDSDRDRLVRKEIGERSGGFNYFGSGRPTERRHVSETVRVNYQRNRQTNLRPDKLVRQIGQTIWSQHGRSLYRLVGELEYEPGISVNQLAHVDLVGPFGVPDVNAGVWLVHAVKHLYSRGDVRTWVVLEKRWEK